jgi:TatA/E family protein of Tat protein translocase
MPFGGFHPVWLLLLLVVVLIIFGPGKLPQLGKALGEGIRELKHATNEEPVPERGGTEAPLAAPGASAAPETRTCPQCQTAVPIQDRFCGTCGAAQPTPGSNAATPSGAR